LKREDTLPTGAFKVRGGVTLVSDLDPEFRDRGLVAASTGNHGQSVAYAGREFDVPAVVCVPEDANPGKVRAMERLGARIEHHGELTDADIVGVQSAAAPAMYRAWSEGTLEPHVLPGKWPLRGPVRPGWSCRRGTETHNSNSVYPLPLFMAKYSTGGGGGGDSETCELCGAADANLRTAKVAGATLQVCPDCAQHDESPSPGGSGGASGSDGGSDRDRKRRAARNTARVHDGASNTGDYWEDGADYDDDQLPYLVSDYGQRVTDARQDAGLQTEELADELDVDESDLIAVEQGRATKAGVGGSLVEALEAELGVELVDET
jgi:ribosome-binding protein aMBF1 (putative translation factor)